MTSTFRFVAVAAVLAAMLLAEPGATATEKTAP